jgi:hypothetical protein
MQRHKKPHSQTQTHKYTYRLTKHTHTHIHIDSQKHTDTQTHIDTQHKHTPHSSKNITAECEKQQCSPLDNGKTTRTFYCVKYEVLHLEYSPYSVVFFNFSRTGNLTTTTKRKRP